MRVTRARRWSAVLTASTADVPYCRHDSLTHHLTTHDLTTHAHPHRLPRPHLARHALPPPGERARRRLRLHRPRARHLARPLRHRAAERSPPTPATGPKAAAARPCSKPPAATSSRSSRCEAQPGDVLIFRWRRGTLAKHCAILSTPAAMIPLPACGERLPRRRSSEGQPQRTPYRLRHHDPRPEGAPVSEVPLPWWRRHLAGAIRLPDPANARSRRMVVKSDSSATPSRSTIRQFAH